MEWRNAVKIERHVVSCVKLRSACHIIRLFLRRERGRRKLISFTWKTNARFDTALSRGTLWDFGIGICRAGRIVWSRSMYQMLGMKTNGSMMGYGDLAELMHPDGQ